MATAPPPLSAPSSPPSAPPSAPPSQAPTSQSPPRQSAASSSTKVEGLAAFLQALFFPSSYQRWNIQNLSYGVYIALTVFFGWSGMDLLYLGSPLAAVLKGFVNTFTFGYWWFYDIIMAIGAGPQVKLFGTSSPLVGSTGIGACRFNDTNSVADPELVKKHMNFFLYGVLLLFLGWLGIDQLFCGQSFNCFLHIAAFITIIGIPLAMTAYAIRSYMLLFDTNRVIDQNWELFGARKPSKQSAECPNITADLASTAAGTVIAIIETAPGGSVVTMIPKLVYRNFVGVMDVATNSVNLIVEALQSVGVIARTTATVRVPTTVQIKEAGQSGGGLAEGGLAEEGLDEEGLDLRLEKELTGGGQGLASELLNAKSLYEEPPLWIPLASGLLALTVGFIVVSSLVLYFRRTFQKKDGFTKATATTTTTTTAAVQQPDQDDDVPPEPGVPRVP